MMKTQTTERLHALDFLRAMAMFLGILLHGVLPFTVTPIPFWPTRDTETSLVAEVFILTVHDFRMQLFFLLAGFFGCLLYQRYGLFGMLRHRFIRIVLPFVIALLVLVPLLKVIWLHGSLTAIRTLGIVLPEHTSRWDLVRQLAETGMLFTRPVLFHMWFLYLLTLFFVFMIPLCWLGSWTKQTTMHCSLDLGFQWLVTSRLGWLFLTVLLIPLVSPSRIWSIDTPDRWLVQVHVLAYYFVFFLFGWMLYRQRPLLEVFQRSWRTKLLVANLLILPLMLGLVANGLQQLTGQIPVSENYVVEKILCLFTGALYTWLMISGLMGAFSHYFRDHRAWVRYLADASYWCYLMHLIPVILVHMLISELPLPGLLKYGIVVIGSTALLLITYEWGVRYTWIGTLLNGPKERPKKQPLPVVDTAMAPTN